MGLIFCRINAESHPLVVFSLARPLDPVLVHAALPRGPRLRFSISVSSNLLPTNLMSVISLLYSTDVCREMLCNDVCYVNALSSRVIIYVCL